MGAIGTGFQQGRYGSRKVPIPKRVKPTQNQTNGPPEAATTMHAIPLSASTTSTTVLIGPRLRRDVRPVDSSLMPSF
jgi:hypothetical protein